MILINQRTNHCVRAEVCPFLFDRKGTMMMKTQFVFQRRLASAPQVSAARARAGDARKQKTGRAYLGMRTGCRQQKTVPSALSVYRPHGNQEETKMMYSFRAFRTAGADVKRGWRILGRVWQHGFTHASAGWHANSRYTAHARSAAGHFAGFAPAAHLGCSRVCGACGNDC